MHQYKSNSQYFIYLSVSKSWNASLSFDCMKICVSIRDAIQNERVRYQPITRYRYVRYVLHDMI